MNKFKRVLCAVLSACIVMMPFAFSASVAGAEDVDSLQQQLEELEQKNQEYQKILDETQQDINEKEEYSKALVSKVEVLDDKIALTRESINELNESIDEKEKDIEKANEDIEDQLDALCERLRIIYMAGNASDIEIIFGAKDFSDFIDKVSLIKTLSNYDKTLIEEINVKLDEISDKKEGLESDKAELEEKQASLEADQAELNSLIEENDEILRNLYSLNQETEDAMKNGEFESEEIENQIKEYYANLQQISQNQSSNTGSTGGSSGGNSGSSSIPSIDVPTTSGYVWPVPGFYYLSSEWSEDRYTYNHGGIDIAGGGIMGATVLAADGGTVIASYNGCPHNWGKNASCGCGGGYGNYVMIDHGNGKMTVYGHMTNIVVSTGQSVSKGQTIGYVGTTGYSTGPHLHFECRYNGVKYNPMDEY